MKFYNYIKEAIEDSGDTGSKGKHFEKMFKKALSLIGLNYESNSATGALWDIKCKGDEWRQIVDDKNTNIKLSRTKWLFGSTELSKMLPWDNIGEEFDKEKYQMKVKRYLNKIGLPDVVFLKVKSEEIQSEILKAVKTEDVEKLKELLVKKNFRVEKLTRNYDVRILTKENRITSIAIDKGGKVFMRSERPRKMGGSIITAFRTPSQKLGNKDKTIVK